MTLLTTIQSACRIIGLTAPSSFVGSTNLLAQELLECAQEEGFDLMRRGTWQVLTKERTFTTVASQTQTDIIPDDFDRFINETFWNRTRKRPLYGPVTPQEWQNLIAWTSSPIQDTFRMRGGDILVTPTPPAGETWAFEYISKNFCQSNTGTAQSAWAADTDTGILDERLMAAGIVWRYKAKKGLPFETDFQKYESDVRQALVQDKPQRTINFGYGKYMGRRPGVVIPEGDWTAS